MRLLLDILPRLGDEWLVVIVVFTTSSIIGLSAQCLVKCMLWARGKCWTKEVMYELFLTDKEIWVRGGTIGYVKPCRSVKSGSVCLSGLWSWRNE